MVTDVKRRHLRIDGVAKSRRGFQPVGDEIDKPLGCLEHWNMPDAFHLFISPVGPLRGRPSC